MILNQQKLEKEFNELNTNLILLAKEISQYRKESSLILEKKINEYLKFLKNPPKNMTLKLGNEKINKETLISALQFAGIIK